MRRKWAISNVIVNAMSVEVRSSLKIIIFSFTQQSLLFRLEIAMNNSLVVDVLDGGQDLCHIKSSTVLVEGAKLAISQVKREQGKVRVSITSKTA
jgi:hypothetical protein